MAPRIIQLNNPPPLDTGNPITPWQSSTIVSALKAMAPQIALIATQLTGKAFDIQTINVAIDSGYSLIASGITIYYCYKTIRGRINATQAIKR